MSTIFEKYIHTASRFNINKKVFESSYLPDRLPHREKEIDILARTYYTSLNGDTPKNVLIFGKTGTGKTAVVKYLGRELKKAQLYYGKNKVEYIYINCEMMDNTYSVLQTIGNYLKSGVQIPFTGWPMDKVYKTLKENLELWKGILVVIFDEIDRLVENAGDDVIYQLLYLDTELKNSSVSLLGISNGLKFTEYLGARVQSRLNEQKIIFGPYNAIQLEDILRERVEKAQLTEYIDDTAIKLAASIAAQEHGDARRAIELIRYSIDLATQEGTNRITDQHVLIARAKLEIDAVLEAVKTLPAQSKLLLLSLILQNEAGKKLITTSELYEAYRMLSRKIGFPTLTMRRVSELVSEIDMLGLINTKVKSFGRYGRAKIIELAVSYREVKNVLLNDEYFAMLKNFSFSKQTVLL